MRVRWRCGAEECSVQVHDGKLFQPHPIFKKRGETDYEYAVRLGLCVDPKPPRGEPVMVVLDDRPGVVQAHTWDELEVIYDEGAQQSPVGGHES